MKSAYDWDIDFDAWSALAADDPCRFEQQRSDLIKEVMAFVPVQRQQRMQGLQWRIDKVRETTHTPLAACIIISNMMHEAVLGNGGLCETLQTLTGQRTHTPPCATRKAVILKFRRPVAD